MLRVQCSQTRLAAPPLRQLLRVCALRGLVPEIDVIPPSVSETGAARDMEPSDRFWVNDSSIVVNCSTWSGGVTGAADAVRFILTVDPKYSTEQSPAEVYAQLRVSSALIDGIDATLTAIVSESPDRLALAHGALLHRVAAADDAIRSNATGYGGRGLLRALNAPTLRFLSDACGMPMSPYAGIQRLLAETEVPALAKADARVDDYVREFYGGSMSGDAVSRRIIDEALGSSGRQGFALSRHHEAEEPLFGLIHKLLRVRATRDPYRPGSAMAVDPLRARARAGGHMGHQAGPGTVHVGNPTMKAEGLKRV